ncbi:MAG: tRNA (guanine-N7)-methyltransferase [Bdellovibrionaceae bacterium]|nr:tRNA (guanine-N7)-methyltransferase [Pseudobdellovibrionaceae bacterium]
MKPEVTATEYRRPQIVLTKSLKHPNAYTKALDGEFREFAFNEERGPENRGRWRSDIFGVKSEHPVDLEIGTGNGVHFQHHSLGKPERCLVGVELKYKPLIQTIRGALKKGARNARIVRYHAFNLDLLFEAGELNDVYIHFPDPWTTPRKPKNRILNPRMLDLFFDLQRPGAKLDFKTDSLEAYRWSMENVRQCKYKIEFETEDLHASPLASENVVTQFERIFLRQGMKINFVRLRKP